MSRGKIIVFLSFFFISLLWFWKEAFFNYLFCFSDLTFYFYPYRYFMSECIRKGVIPLWNPYLLLGYPFLATLQPGVFYPFSLLYYLFPFDRAFSWFLILHYPLGCFFMYLLCREFKFSQAASVASGLTFGFSGYLLSVLHMPNTLSSVIWLPLVLLYFRRSLLPTAYSLLPTNVILTSIFLAFMFLGGEPTVLYGTVLMMVGYGVLMNQKHTVRGVLRGVGWLGVVLVLAGLLSAVQLLPFVELFFHSSRAGGITFAEASYFSLPAKKLLEFIFPYFFHLTEFPWATVDWAKFPYLGIIPAVLALFALFFSKNRRTWWLGLAALVIIFIILGSNSPLPLYYFLYKFVPGFNFFRYPIKFTFVLVFIVSVLVGMGVEALEERIRSRKLVLTITAWGLLILIPLLVLYFYLQAHSQAIFLILRPLFADEIRQGYEEFVRSVTVPRDLANFGILIFLLALFLGWLMLCSFSKTLARALGWGLVLLIFMDLYTANAGSNFSFPAKLYREIVPPNIRLLLADKGTFRYFVSPEIYRQAHYENYQDFHDYQRALYLLRERLTSNQGMLFSLSDVDGYESLRGKDQDKILQRIWKPDTLEGISILNLLNVKYLVSAGPFKQKGYQLLTQTKDPLRSGEIWLYRNNNCLPRSFFVPKAKVLADREAILDYLFSPQFKPTEEVILEQEVKSPGGFWFTSEWFYPGWKAYVNGKETKIYRANYMFRAVPVPSAKAEVKFVYEPPLFKWGSIISMATFLILLSFLFLNKYQ